MRNWEDVLPEKLAMYQAAWEKRRRIMHARNNGATFNEIAKALKISRERVRHMDAKARRSENKKSPVELYLSDFPWNPLKVDFYNLSKTEKQFDKNTFKGRAAIREISHEFEYRIRGII
jgi:transcriptional regulator